MEPLALAPRDALEQEPMAHLQPDALPPAFVLQVQEAPCTWAAPVLKA